MIEKTLKKDERAEEPVPPQSPEASRRGKQLVRYLVFVFLFALAATGGSLTGLLLAYQTDLPLVETLEKYQPSIITQIFADDGTVIAEFAIEKRVVISLNELPDHVKQAFVAAEDKRFYSHPGIDVLGIARAFIRNQLQGRIVGGGSTITQQLSRSLFLTRTTTYERKVKEAILAFQIEKNYTKNEILNFYANHIHLGHGLYGWEAAAQYYFDKHARELTLAEAALIAGLPPLPSRYSPYVDFDAARRRQSYVLNRMLAEGFISEADLQRAKEAPLNLRRRGSAGTTAPYFVEDVRRYLQEKYGSQRIYRGGLRVYTTLNIPMQKSAEKALDKALRDLDKRQGFRPIQFNIHRDSDGLIEDYVADDWVEPFEEGQVLSGVVTGLGNKTVDVRVGRYTATLDGTGIEWTRSKNPADILKIGDVTDFQIQSIDEEKNLLVLKLDQEPEVEGSFLCLDIRSGQIKAMIGGFDFERSEFNRATQAMRQPGSAFKPFAYAAAIDLGFTPTSLLLDQPVRYEDPNSVEKFYEPHNYDRKYEGWVTLRRAIEGSRNVPAVKLNEQIGPERSAEMARRLGLSGPIPPYLSIVLGAAEATLLEMVSAYSAFPNQGIRMRPYLVTKVTDRDGNLLEETHPKALSAIRADTAYIVTSLLRGVVQRGTAIRAASLGRPLGGKTGTTNDYTDAWFIGFDPRIAAGVWVGHDQKIPLGDKETGAKAALPAWLTFMEETLAERPVEDFPIPSNIVFVPVEKHTGYPAHGSGKDVILEGFIAGTEPSGYPRTQ